MRGIIQWAVERPTIVNLLMAGICILGLVAMDQVPKQIFPDTALDMVFVRVIQRGAGPQEMEKGALLQIEEAIQGISGIDRVSCEAKENLGIVRIELERGAEVPTVLREVKDKVEQISNFPADAEKPQIFEVVRRAQVISFALHGEVSRAALQKLADRIKDDLLAKSRIKLVQVKGAKQREISIEIDEANLRKYSLRVSDISAALKRTNLDLSGGVIRTQREDFILRAYGKRYLARDIEKIVVRTLPGGTSIRIQDIATAKETFADSPTQFTFNGKPALLINVMRTSSQNALKLVSQAHEYHKAAQQFLPPNVTLSIYRDRTIELRERIALLTSNGIQGLILVLITLSLLMNLRLSLWVAAGLPISLLGTFIIMWFTNVTVNMISLFGMLLVIGILVDDAIVVGENIYAHVERGKSPLQAAIDGTAEVLPAVFAAVSTTMLAFMPLFFMGGIVGKFIYVIPAVVIAALFLSLIESALILPPHLAHSLKPRGSAEHTQNRLRTALDNAFKWVNTKVYAKHLRFLLRNRWPVLATAIAVFLFSIGLIGGGFIKFVFFPRLDSDRIVARFVMKPGTPQHVTQGVIARIEKAANDVNNQLHRSVGQKVIVHRAAWIGEHTQRGPGFSPPSGEEVGEVQLELVRGEQRKVSSYKVIDLWRKRVGAVVGATQLSFDSLGIPPLGRPLELNLLSNQQDQLHAAVKFMKKRLSSFSGVYDPEDDLTLGKRELRLRLTPLAKSLGLTLQEIASQIRYRVYGLEVMRLQRGRDEVRVFVRYPERNRRSINQFERLSIRTRQSKEIPLSQLATWKYTRTLQVIRRIDRKRMATVFAILDDTKTSRQEVVQGMQNKALSRLHKIAPAVRISFEGQGREQARVFGGMKVAFPLALFGIFAILVAVFQSYNQAFIIMAMIPFGVIGAVFGHIFMGVNLTILSFFGIVGLTGMVVNDSLVLMDTINRYLREGYGVLEAAWEAGQRRLRAILSTTLTTVAGLAPLLLEKSLQAQFLIPMAISVAFGILFATVITLVIVPCLFVITNDVRRFVHWLRHGYWPLPTDVEPESIRAKQPHH